MLWMENKLQYKLKSSIRMGKAAQLFATVFIASTLLASCFTNPRPSRAEIPVDAEVIEASGKFRKEYVLVPGDQIEVSVWRVPEVSRVVVVRPDGNISLPMLHSVKAAGLTFPELEEKLTKLFAERLLDPDVTIIATQIRQSMVYVLGDVGLPKAVPLHQATTAVQAIALAGGLRRTGAIRDVSIVRLGEDGILRAVPVEVEEADQTAPYLALSLAVLQPDDIVFVPESGRSEVVRFMDEFVGRPLSYMVSFRVIEQGF